MRGPQHSQQQKNGNLFQLRVALPSPPALESTFCVSPTSDTSFAIKTLHYTPTSPSWPSCPLNQQQPSISTWLKTSTSSRLSIQQTRSKGHGIMPMVENTNRTPTEGSQTCKRFASLYV